VLALLEHQAPSPPTGGRYDEGDGLAHERLHVHLWDRRSFVRANAERYGPETVTDVRTRSGPFSEARNRTFLEFVRAERLASDAPPERPWFGDAVRRSPAELRALYETARGTVGTLAEVIGGHCVSHGFCAAKFACVGCAGKVPDPATRHQVERHRTGAERTSRSPPAASRRARRAHRDIFGLTPSRAGCCAMDSKVQSLIAEIEALSEGERQTLAQEVLPLLLSTRAGLEESIARSKRCPMPISTASSNAPGSAPVRWATRR